LKLVARRSRKIKILSGYLSNSHAASRCDETEDTLQACLQSMESLPEIHEKMEVNPEKADNPQLKHDITRLKTMKESLNHCERHSNICRSYFYTPLRNRQPSETEL
jgi:hypothetical protein